MSQSSAGTSATMAQSTPEAITTLRLHDKDVGSSQVQIARLSGRIKHLTTHLGMHKKDKHTRRGLIALISRRRKLTTYLKRSAPATHAKTLSTLGLRK
ncbi:MAG: 30S ribosomal protein S15 [Gammaproteobacteria bacterium WSBS_2016_MAG_OTU1]